MTTEDARVRYLIAAQFLASDDIPDQWRDVWWKASEAWALAYDLAVAEDCARRSVARA